MHGFNLSLKVSSELIGSYSWQFLRLLSGIFSLKYSGLILRKWHMIHNLMMITESSLKEVTSYKKLIGKVSLTFNTSVCKCALRTASAVNYFCMRDLSPNFCYCWTVSLKCIHSYSKLIEIDILYSYLTIVLAVIISTLKSVSQPSNYILKWKD